MRATSDGQIALSVSLLMKVLVAAFSVSPYAATYYRAGQKPFNPLLGETYECIREDKGWRFLAEQVGIEGGSSFGLLSSFCNLSQALPFKARNCAIARLKFFRGAQKNAPLAVNEE